MFIIATHDIQNLADDFVLVCVPFALLPSLAELWK
jgi:hypothetical protein